MSGFKQKWKEREKCQSTLIWKQFLKRSQNLTAGVSHVIPWFWFCSASLFWFTCAMTSALVPLLDVALRRVSRVVALTQRNTNKPAKSSLWLSFSFSYNGKKGEISHSYGPKSGPPPSHSRTELNSSLRVNHLTKTDNCKPFTPHPTPLRVLRKV